jgi:hypothetical protein
MVKSSVAPLDLTFAALSDATRRALSLADAKPRPAKLRALEE